MHDHFYAVIMAGGGGTRLWPLSRLMRPKQMVRLGSDRTLFQLAVDRLEGVFPPERILVVTVEAQAARLQEMAPSIPVENYLLEPLPRGTASVVGLAALAIRRRDPQGVIVMLTADHLIGNVAHFHELLEGAYQLAEQGYLTTLGVRPTFPATGYGYIQHGKRLEDVVGLAAYRVQQFKEKPDEKTARKFLQSRDHDWNSGMFIWRAARIWEEIQHLMPTLAGFLDKIDAAWDTPERTAVLADQWPLIQPQTVDYGIMEKANQVAVLPAADLGWNDVGNWDSLFEVIMPDENGNVVLDAKHVALDTKNSLVCAERPDRLIVTIGTHDLIVVDTQDAILICSRDRAQKVRELVAMLRRDEDLTRYL